MGRGTFFLNLDISIIDCSLFGPGKQCRMDGLVKFVSEVKPCIKQVFTSWKASQDLSVLSPADCDVLLQDPPQGDGDVRKPSWNDFSEGFIPPYPDYPLYDNIAQVLGVWMKTGSCPILHLPALTLLEEGTHVTRRKLMVDTVTPMLVDLKGSLQDAEAAQAKLNNIISTLGKRGLMDILGMRQTVGSIECFPPPRTLLEESFNQQNKPSSKLSVGAKALAKHCHRDQTSSWWGESTGSEQAKNDHAAEVLRRILDQAAWINIHMLPHDVTTLEVRSPEGYGARWSSDGKAFRGFLEPQMADGHEVGWKH